MASYSGICVVRRRSGCEVRLSPTGRPGPRRHPHQNLPQVHASPVMTHGRPRTCPCCSRHTRHRMGTDRICPTPLFPLHRLHSIRPVKLALYRCTVHRLCGSAGPPAIVPRHAAYAVCGVGSAVAKTALYMTMTGKATHVRMRRPASTLRMVVVCRARAVLSMSMHGLYEQSICRLDPFC